MPKVKPIQYFGTCPEIAKFAEEFEQLDNSVALSDSDRAAVVAVLAQHAWGLFSGLEEHFWTNAEIAIGDGVETSFDAEFDEAEENRNSPMWRSLMILSTLTNPDHCYDLIAYLVQCDGEGQI